MPVIRNKEIKIKYNLDDWIFDKSDGKKVEELLPHADLMKDRYWVFPDGGYHPLCQVSKHKTDLPEIYRKPVWPWVASIKKNVMRQVSTALKPNGYVALRLMTNKFLQSGKRKKFEYDLHLLLGKAFVHNPDPKNKTVIDHIDNNSCNYLISNLRYATRSENSRDGSPPQDMDLIFDQYKKTRWFNDPATTINLPKEFTTRVTLKPTQQLSLELTFKKDGIK